MNDNQITYITTCKGRLHHLKQSLPLVAAQPDLKVIVVDYDCPEGTGEWVRANFPSVQVVKVSNAPYFQLSHARNVGARAATTRWLAFFDADVILPNGFFSRVSNFLTPGAFFLPRTDAPNLWGSVIVERDAFMKAGEYDEAITHWGGEDIAFYSDLRFLGYAMQGYEASDMKAIEHGDEERVKFGMERDLARAKQLSHVYEIVRLDLSRLMGRLLNLHERRVLRERVTQVLDKSRERGGAVERVTFDLPKIEWQRPTLGDQTPIVEKTLIYNIKCKK